jgi:hypothetical protein
MQHCSISGPSLCTQKHISQYLNFGTLPEAGTVCPVNKRLFPFPLTTTQLKDALADETLALGQSDRDMLEAVVNLSALKLSFGPFLG